MAKMNPQVKAKWVAALRSGEYKQFRGRLRHADQFSCLGVLCDLYDKDSNAGGWGASYGSGPTYLRSVSYLPSAVRTWAEVDRNPALEIGRTRANVAEFNDAWNKFEPRSFSELADAIEAQL